MTIGSHRRGDGKILVVDDEEQSRSRFDMLESKGYHCQRADGRAAQEQVKNFTPDLFSVT